MVYTLILAGGHGTRMGGSVPKQFLALDGVPVIIHTVRVLAENKNTDLLCVVSPAEYVGYTEKLIEDMPPAEKRCGKDIFVCSGGSNRSMSLLAGLEFLKSRGARDEDIVITHDAVRPFIDDRIIDENIEAARIFGGATTVIESADSIVAADAEGFMCGSVERSTIRRCQTPQTFRFGSLYGAMKEMKSEESESFTDAASLFLSAGFKVKLVEGSDKNIKLTRPCDMKTALLFCGEDEE